MTTPGSPTTATSAGLHRRPGGWFYTADRPGPGWHAHGTTPRRLWLLHDGGVSPVVLHKQRWKHVSTGRTSHDRPPLELPWTPFGLAAVFTVLAAWWRSQGGLWRLSRPWHGQRPHARTLQRWLAHLAARALAWHVAMRDVVVDRLAPSTIEEMFPAGLDPPGTMARFRVTGPQVGQLEAGHRILQKAAPLLSVPWSALVVEARRTMMADTHH